MNILTTEITDLVPSAAEPMAKGLTEDSVLVQLPDDVVKLLKSLFLHAQTMCRSTNLERVEKGESLNSFINEIKSQKGNLQGIHDVIASFTTNQEFMDIIQKHNNPWYEFFFNNTTTHSEDSIKELSTAVQRHLGC